MGLSSRVRPRRCNRWWRPYGFGSDGTATRDPGLRTTSHQCECCGQPLFSFGVRVEFRPARPRQKPILALRSLLVRHIQGPMPPRFKVEGSPAARGGTCRVGGKAVPYLSGSAFDQDNVPRPPRRMVYKTKDERGHDTRYWYTDREKPDHSSTDEPKNNASQAHKRANTGASSQS